MESTAARRRTSAKVIERASATDRAFLAIDSTRAPEQFGVVLCMSGGGLNLEAVRGLMAARLPGVPRLRQRLVAPPPGCGGPIWVDDPRFRVDNHVRAVVCASPGDEQALLDTAVTIIGSPLSRAGPLWSAVLVTGLADQSVALVLVLHHVLADGIGGLAVLATLVDGCSPPADTGFPRPRPAMAELAADNLRSRAQAVRRIPVGWRLVRSSLTAGGGLHPPRAAACSLITPTGRRRRAAVVRVDLGALRSAAHRHEATTNDAVLTAVAAALGRVLLARGERVDELVVTVPVSSRILDDRGEGGDLGNQVSPILVTVPTRGELAWRLERVASQVRANRANVSGPPPIGTLGWAFRPLARLGGFRWYMNHQHRFHTLISHVRGPGAPVTLGGAAITSAIPLGVGGAGNTTAYFEVLTYAGTLTITTIVDPDNFPDLESLRAGLMAELHNITDLHSVT